MFFLSSWLRSYFAFFFRPVRVPPSFLELAQAVSGRKPSPDETVENHVLVTQSDSLVMEGLLLSLARRSGLGQVKKLTGTDASLKEKCLNWVCMHESQAVKEIFQKQPATRFHTFNIFQLRGPIRNTPNNRPGAGWLLGLLLTRRLLFVEVGPSIPAHNNSVFRLLRQVKLDFYRHLKLVRGTPFLTMAAQERVILSGREFERELNILAQRAGETPERMRKRATDSFYELAANPRRFMYSLLSVFARLVVRRLFSDVRTNGLERIIPAIKTNTVILVPMHRSHLDYILVGHKLYESNVNPPIVAAGINLSFWPAGFLIRSVGGYFVKRNARDRLHALILRRYVTHLTKRGHSQEFFIEGGRSRGGKMLSPKVGLLSIYIDAFLKGLRKDIFFVPVSISYENVVEAEDLAAENVGGSKARENFLSFLRSLDVFKRKYGEAIVNFGSPISLAAYCAEQGIKPYSHSQEARSRTSDRNLAQDLGLKITDSIRGQINPTLSELACTALLSAPGYALPRKELGSQIRKLGELLKSQKQLYPEMGDFTRTLSSFLAGNEAALNDIARAGLVRVQRCFDEEVFMVPGRRRVTADFYRGITAHFFFDWALISLLHASARQISSAEAMHFCSILSSEYLLGKSASFQARFQSALALFKAEGLLAGPLEGCTLTEKGARFLMPSFLLSSLESALWVHYNLKHHRFAAEPEDEREDGEAGWFSFADFLRTLQDDFSTAQGLGLVSRTEAASKSSLMAALEALNERQIISYSEKPGQRKAIQLLSDNSAELTFLASTIASVKDWESRHAQKWEAAQG